MSRPHGCLSQKATKRFRAGDLLLRGFDNEEIMAMLEVSLSSVKRWRKKIESNRMKNEDLPNFVPTMDEELVSAVYAAAMKINDKKKIHSCFNNAGSVP